MKVLKMSALAVFGALGVVIVALFLLGLRPRAGRNEHTVEIVRPAAAVFPWLIEPERLKQWIGGLAESTPLTEGGIRVGARSQEVIIERGQRYAMETEVTAYEPDRLLGVLITSDGFEVDGRYELEQRGNTTYVHYVGDARYRVWFARLMEPVVTPAAQKALEQNMGKLKTLVESSPR
jgi:uncharacterized protein YndB with AHSA1/START domain